MTHKPILGAVFVLTALLLPVGCRAGKGPERYFTIEVVDEQTKRGVPLVELRTVNEVRYYTDSAGLVAFYEPGLMDRDVFFYVTSHGYAFPKDGFGMRGKRLRTRPGGTGQIRIKRTNIAERLYRITGQGIYRDTVLVGRQPPTRKPVLNGRVLGQDSVMALPYRGKIHWFWGDTSRESYPLGQFAMSGATSQLPAQGGLDPSVGVDLAYFVDDEGFSRKMAPLPEHGMVWLDGFLTLPDDSGRERLVAHYGLMKSLGERLEHGLMVLSDEKEVFERLLRLADDVRLHPQGQAFRVTTGGQAYWYFAQPYPFVRVTADWKAWRDPAAYEAFTCLAPGSDYEKDAPSLDRGPHGRLVWGWKRNTAVLDAKQQAELVASGKMKAGEAWIGLRDAGTGKALVAHRASVHWNAFRRRWIMILCEFWGTSALGEIWYAEADKPEGPWRRARKIVTHEKYSFYNPAHHPFFDQEGGRIIYFEGTYTKAFSGAAVATPRYDYNQIMYRLDLADRRLALPTPGPRGEESAERLFQIPSPLAGEGRVRGISGLIHGLSPSPHPSPIKGEGVLSGRVRVFQMGSAAGARSTGSGRVSDPPRTFCRTVCRQQEMR